MSAIHFFTPITFDVVDKTGLEEMVEWVDEYFYLGDSPRVSILPAADAQGEPIARELLTGRDRTWDNIAIKVASYCTLILPLIALLAKAILRSLVGIYSIQQVNPAACNGVLEAVLYTDLLKSVALFLSYSDRGKLAQAAHFTSNVVRDQEQTFIEQTARLKVEIEALPPGIIPDDEFERLHTDLLNSPVIDHPRHWAPLMNRLIEHSQLAIEVQTKIGHPNYGRLDDVELQRLLVDLLHSPILKHPPSWNLLVALLLRGCLDFLGEVELLQKHTNIAQLLVSSEPPATAEQMYSFCNCLGTELLLKASPFRGYSILDKYMNTHRASVERALQEFLMRKAQEHINTKETNYGLHGPDGEFLEQKLYFKEAIIDLRIWFGYAFDRYKPWLNYMPNDIPVPIRDAIWTRIQELQADCPDYLLMIRMSGDDGAQVPFTAELAKLIKNNGIFIVSNPYVPYFYRNPPHYKLTIPGDGNLEEIAAQYPNAVR